MQVFVPGVDDAIIPRWIARMNGLGMRCEIHPGFSFKDHSGFLPFRVSLERSAHEQLVSGDYLVGFELYVREFNLAREVAALTPKRTLLEKLSRRRREPVYLASPEIDQKLARCTKELSFVWGSADTLELRLATLSAAILSEITDGVCFYPADNIWYSNEGIVENALKEAESYESSLKPTQLKLHRFERWL